MNLRVRVLSLVAAGAALSFSLACAADKKPVLTKLTVDPAAPVVDLFEAMDAGKLQAKLVHRDETMGNVFVENLTDGPLTVRLPESFVGVHVLNQLGGGGGGFGGGGQQGGGQGGQGQSTGGGQQGGGQQGGGQQGGGGGAGFFSIPPERTVRFSIRSVCLEYGKPTPSPRMEYRIVPVEKVSKDPVLKELLSLVATGQCNQKAAQAAAWHLANGKSAQELAAIMVDNIGVADYPHFTSQELVGADQLLVIARQRAADRAEKGDQPAEPVKPVLPSKKPGRSVSQR